MSGSEQARGLVTERSFFAGLARAIVRLRFAIAPLWVAAAVAAAALLPSIFSSGGGALGNLLPSSSRAIVAEHEALERFGLPFVSPTLAVAHEDRRLSRRQLSGLASYLAAADRGPQPSAPVRALPLLDVPGELAPSGPRTTLLDYLYVNPALKEGARRRAAERFAAGMRRAGGIDEVDLTGPVPAGWAQERLGNQRLLWLELATVAVVIAVLSLYFRAVGVPFLGIATVGVAYLCAAHLLGWLGAHTGVTVPTEVGPVIVALLFGTLTDYLVFFVSGWRRRLAAGAGSLEAVEEVTAELLPVVLTAALMISGSIVTLLVSGVRFLTAFVPGMTVSVLVGAAVAVTFVPTMLALVGPRLLWPHGPGEARPAREEASRPRSRLVGLAAGHPLLVLAPCAAALAAVAVLGLRGAALGDPVIRGLPASSAPRRGYAAVGEAFGAGVVGPTMLIVAGDGVTARRAQLARLQSELAAEPGVALALGPADDPLARRTGVVFAPGGGAARYALVLDGNPSGAGAVSSLGRIEEDLPALLRRAGLGSDRTLIAGDTAVSAELDQRTDTALLWALPGALLVLGALLWALLRSRAAALYLVATSVLVVGAALGITVWFFSSLLGYGEVAFFVPIAAAILLLALGSDYNVFFVSRIWQEAERAELRDAIRIAGSRAARAITVAGMVLVLSFAAVALVPILAFRELAFAMCVGLLLDTLVARTFLVPALVSLFSRPGRDLPRPRRPQRR